jgi:hypothetical protein
MQLLTPGDLGYFESINKETIMNAFKRYQDLGLLTKKTVQPSTTNETGVPDPPTVLYAVHSNYVGEATALLGQQPEGLYKDFYAFSNDTKLVKTKLWDFCEQIGRFRREGKHRRDNETTGKRTLRLARIARSVAGNELSGAKL